MIIKVSNLNKSYLDADVTLTVIDDLSIEFFAPAAIGIVGKSGVGKSTLLHLLGGLDRPTKGSVFYDDINISALSPEALSSFRGENVGFIFQFHHLLPEFTAIENCALPLIISGESDSVSMDKAETALSVVGLKERITHRPGQLSGGEQQRVAIARAIVAKPKVILADEPTGNLDSYNARLVEELLLNVHSELKNLMIIVTHNNELASRLDARFELVTGGQLKN